MIVVYFITQPISKKLLWYSVISSDLVKQIG